MNTWRNYIASSMLAGMCVSMVCIVYIKLGGIAGAVLFGFALITVVHYGFKLFTGTAGFCMNRRDLYKLAVILAFNFIGCLLMAFVMKYIDPDVSVKSIDVISRRLTLSPIKCGIMGIFCGFIMTAAVRFGREGKWLPLIFGVPVFIFAGFLHSIADAFYINVAPTDYLLENPSLYLRWLMVAAGNFVGCNLVRIMTWNKNG